MTEKTLMEFLKSADQQRLAYKLVDTDIMDSMEWSIVETQEGFLDIVSLALIEQKIVLILHFECGTPVGNKPSERYLVKYNGDWYGYMEMPKKKLEDPTMEELQGELSRLEAKEGTA